MTPTIQPTRATFGANGPICLPQAQKTASGSLRVPGDKSMSHRSLLFAALASGDSVVGNVLAADDVASTERVLVALGVRIERGPNGHRTICGRGLQFAAPSSPLDCGNAGTCLRLMAGALVATNTPARLTGDASLLRRPMGPLVACLKRMGANIRCLGTGPHGEALGPIEVGRRGPLSASAAHLPVPSAQLATALMLASLGATGRLALTGLGGARDHSERMLAAMGVAFAGGRPPHGELAMAAGQALSPLCWQVPGDLSSAAFWLAAAAIVPGSDLTIEAVSLNESRLAFVRLLKRMGAEVTITPCGQGPAQPTAEPTAPATANDSQPSSRMQGTPDEPVGSIRLQSRPLHAVSLKKDDAAALIDELPLLAAIASYASGTTIVRGAAQLRVKESDRIAAMTAELTKMGAAIEALPDGFVVQGKVPPEGGPSCVLQSHGDHRVAMALAVASLGAKGPVMLTGADVANISYRGFWPAWQQMFLADSSA